MACLLCDNGFDNSNTGYWKFITTEGVCDSCKEEQDKLRKLALDNNIEDWYKLLTTIKTKQNKTMEQNLDFKTYIGTKKLKAVPMNKSSYNSYRGWTMPENEDGSEEGYLVEYLDGGKPNDVRHEGYISWSPKDVFEKAYKEDVEETFLDRLIKEEKELGEKIVGLAGALNKDNFNKVVGDYQFDLLGVQHSAMLAYRKVLIMRINDLINK